MINLKQQSTSLIDMGGQSETHPVASAARLTALEQQVSKKPTLKKRSVSLNMQIGYSVPVQLNHKCFTKELLKKCSGKEVVKAVCFNDNATGEPYAAIGLQECVILSVRVAEFGDGTVLNIEGVYISWQILAGMYDYESYSLEYYISE